MASLWSPLSVYVLIFNFCPHPPFLFLLMLLCVVTPRRVIRHHCHLISLGNLCCLLIPSASSLLSSPLAFSILPRSLLSLFGLPVVRLGTKLQRHNRKANQVCKKIYRQR